MFCLKVPRNVPVRSCMKRWEVKSWRHCNTSCVPAWIGRETGLFHLQLWGVSTVEPCQCLPCLSWLLASAGNACALCQATAVSHWSVHPGTHTDRWVWVGNSVHPHSLFLQEKPPLQLGKKTQTPSRTGWQLAGVFLRWNTLILTKVVFLFTTNKQRISAAAWIPLEDAEEPVRPVSMETHAGGGGWGTTREEQGEAK